MSIRYELPPCPVCEQPSVAVRNTTDHALATRVLCSKGCWQNDCDMDDRVVLDAAIARAVASANRDRIVALDELAALDQELAAQSEEVQP